jgi:hypothetical protein
MKTFKNIGRACQTLILFAMLGVRLYPQPGMRHLNLTHMYILPIDSHFKNTLINLFHRGKHGFQFHTFSVSIPARYPVSLSSRWQKI